MVYITGDCHANWRKFSTDNFPEQKEMSRDDFVIVCGDFGIWHDTSEERWWLKWLENKPFTILFVDGNHENFDRLYGDEFEIVEFYGGKAHKIRNNIYHLMRGYIFELCGKKFFAFGGASSHDIDDGILDPNDYVSNKDLVKDYTIRTRKGEMLRVNHQSWWRQELPSEEEMNFGMQTLADNNNRVDFVISHCLPQSISSIAVGCYECDILTMYFDQILNNGLIFDGWYAGHYHKRYDCMGKFHIFYEEIERII